MTLDEENKLISEISTVSKVPVDMVRAVFDAQMVRVMQDLGTVKISITFFGKIELRDNRIVLTSANKRLRDFIVRKKLVARVMFERPALVE